MEFERGQTVLIVLLMTAVVLTVGLSVVSRTVTDVHISGQSQESARAFWVAQGKLDEAIRSQSAVSGNTDNITYQVTKTDIVGANQSYLFPFKVEEGRLVNLWLVDHDANGQLTSDFYTGASLNVYWGSDIGFVPAANLPALEATLIYKDDSGNYRSVKFAFDPNTARSDFSPVSSGDTINDISFAYSAQLTFSGLPNYDHPYLLTLKPLFNTGYPQQIAVKTDDPARNIFKQGSSYSSTASVDVSNITRKVTEYRFWPAVPEIFSYLLYSGGELTAQ